MQLVSMEVNRYGSNDQLTLGPISQGLNAICGPTGSGKTTLLNWLRQMVVAPAHSNSSYSPSGWANGAPLNGSFAAQSPLYGRLEVRNQQRNIGITQTSDGQRHLANMSPAKMDTLHSAASNVLATLTPEQQHAFSELTSIQASADNTSRLEALAKQLGFDKPLESGVYETRRSLLTRQDEIHARLRSLEGVKSTRERLLTQRGHLEAELHRVQRELTTRRSGGLLGERERLEEQRSALSGDLRDLRAELATLERDIAGHRSGWPLRRAHHELDIGATYREQLEQLDARLDRWRQTLRDLRSHRERLEHNATDARLDKQIGDQLSTTKSPEPRAALRALESQILNASRQLEVLVDRYDRNHEYASTTASLPETLRHMQRDLYEVCQQLARHESTAAAETYRQQVTQLSRCENELLQSVEKLIEERAGLLRKIADEYHLSMDQLTLAFGDWCECHDHPHLYQWLVNEAPGAYRRNVPERDASELYQAETHVWEERRERLQGRVAEVQAQLKDIESQIASRRSPEPVRVARSEADILLELDKVTAELHDLEERDRLRVELDDIRRSLAKLPVETTAYDKFSAIVNRHIEGLVGDEHRSGSRGRYGLDLYNLRAPVRQDQRFGALSRETYYQNRATNPNLPLTNGVMDARRGIAGVPTSVIELALRLAIVELMAERGSPIALLADSPLDHLAPELQNTAIRHLEKVAASGQQVVLFSSDERIAELVRSARGWVGYMNDWKSVASSTKRLRPAVDLNKQLLAYANDHEAEKWSEPLIPRANIRYRTASSSGNGRLPRQLTERSLIEECPSLDSTCSARCRALGIDRVGDLLATDAHWLAEHLRLSGVSSSTVERWQAETKLLCSVRQLRPFDARVLVGAGIRHPRQLAEMHPSQLLDRVERFLGTDRGREILRSGNSYELSRITSWIASAKGGEPRERRHADNNHVARHLADFNYSENSAQYETGYRSMGPVANSSEEDAYDADDYYDLPDAGPILPVEQNNYGEGFSRRRGSVRADRNGNPRRRDSQDRREPGQPYQVINRDTERTPQSSRSREAVRERPARVERSADEAREKVRVVASSRKEAVAKSARFYLELSSPIVDAPAIGPRMATKFESIGIHTIEQLLAGNADSIAQRLQTKRVDSNTVRTWQDQSRLVCRIPNLRGHDAQLLVACNVTSPEELSKMQASSLLARVSAIVRGPEGQRILRGSQEPDLAEVGDWINWAAHSRSLNAA
jgi:predicted flap endonuclease-1-like 5' DNA nuclease/energy-coupling factor transporter ATP-binding protein EcfA2